VKTFPRRVTACSFSDPLLHRRYMNAVAASAPTVIVLSLARPSGAEIFHTLANRAPRRSGCDVTMLVLRARGVPGPAFGDGTKTHLPAV